MNSGGYNIKKISGLGVLSSSYLSLSDLFVDSVYYCNLNNVIIGFADFSLFNINDGVISGTGSVTNTFFASILENPYNSDVYIVSDSGASLYVINPVTLVVKKQISLSNTGQLVFNNYDGNVYINSISSTHIYVFSPLTNEVFITLDKNLHSIKPVYNYSNKRLIGLCSDNVVESYLIDFTLSVDYRDYSDIYKSATLYKNSQGIKVLKDNQDLFDNNNYYGTLSSEYLDEVNSVYNNFILLRVRDYIRFPRENYTANNDVKVKYVWSFSDDKEPSIFLYDTSKTLNKLSELTFNLDYIDSITDITYIPNPMQINIGYNSTDEGVNSAMLVCKKIEDIKLIVNTSLDVNYMTLTNVDDLYGTIIINVYSSYSFTDYNFKVGQIIKVTISDVSTDKYNVYNSPNNGKTFKVKSVSYKELIVDYIDEMIVDESTVLSDRNLKYIINVEEKTILEVSLYGQTEIEDFRYKIELENTGKLIAPEDIYIFKPYDINEKGVDWTYLNKKRKEMILVRNDIYNYIGSYKAIINAINYFGYNDLTLNEYYIVTDTTSPNYGKKIKIAIPDIFNNSVLGWNDEYYTNLLEKYGETNLFNLSFNITDIDGNNIQYYSVDEVVTKLTGLKKWLQKNVVPLTHKILDITGVAKTKSINKVRQSMYDVTKFTSTNKLTPVIANVTEVYKMPVQSGSSVYNVVFDFTTRNSVVADNFEVEILTYKTYEDWDTFKNYKRGDTILYLSNTFEAVSDNLNKNPYYYKGYFEWSPNLKYKQYDIITYLDSVYTYQLLTETVVYNLNDYKTDLYNYQLGDKPSYLEVINDAEYSYIDIVSCMTANVVAPTYITYDGTWNISNVNVTPYSYVDVNGTVNTLGYNSNLQYNPSFNIISYYMNVINVDSNRDNIFIGGNVNSVNSIVYTPIDTLVPNKDYGFVISGISSFPTGIVLNIEYEKSVNNYVSVCSFNSNNFSVGEYIFNSTLANPRFRVSYTYDLTYQTNTFYNLQSLMNRVINFAYEINSTLDLNVYVSHPELIVGEVKNLIASVYYDNVLNDIHSIINNTIPVNSAEALLFVDNMMDRFFVNKTNYKLQYANVSPAENLLLDNNDFIVWNDITIWKKVSLKPVQRISECRVSDMKPLNFTVDSKIDPYVIINVITENGYGHSYKYEKSYEIKYNADLL